MLDTRGGEQRGRPEVPGTAASFTRASEGTTTVTFHATDNAGNVEGTKTLAVMIDKTPPTLTFGTATPAPNAAGWNNTNVSVAFTVADALSGVASTLTTTSPISRHT